MILRPVSRRLLRAAAKRLPGDSSARYEQEWLAEAAELRPRDAFVFAIQVRLRARSTGAAVAGSPDGPQETRDASAPLGFGPLAPDPLAAARLRDILRRHPAPPRWAQVLAAMRQHTLDIDHDIEERLAASAERFEARVRDRIDEFGDRLEQSHRTPLVAPAAPWPRSASRRQLWRVEDVRELESEHLQNEVNWLINSELRRARFKFGSAETPEVMIEAMRETARQAVSEAISWWTHPRHGGSTTLDAHLRHAIRRSHRLHLVREVPESAASAHENLRRAS